MPPHACGRGRRLSRQSPSTINSNVLPGFLGDKIKAWTMMCFCSRDKKRYCESAMCVAVAWLSRQKNYWTNTFMCFRLPD
jgi:hypothetical protein